MIAPCDGVGACTYCEFKPNLPARSQGDYIERQERRRRGWRVRDADPRASNDRRVLADHAARERIAGELGANLGVEAGAGTGKTTVLVAAGRQACSPPARRPSISSSVITFTEKAAAELSTRVRDALERRASEADGEERERLLAAARDLYRCAHRDDPQLRDRRCCASGQSRPGIDPLFEVRRGPRRRPRRSTPPTSAFQDELLSATEPRRSTGRCAAVSVSRSCARRASMLNQYRYLLPLAHPRLDAGDGLAISASTSCARSPTSCGR